MGRHGLKGEGRKAGQTEGRKEGQMDGQKEGRKDRQMEGEFKNSTEKQANQYFGPGPPLSLLQDPALRFTKHSKHPPLPPPPHSGLPGRYFGKETQMTGRKERLAQVSGAQWEAGAQE